MEEYSDVELYEQYKNTPIEELDAVIEEISGEETKYLDMEISLDEIKEKINEKSLKLEEYMKRQEEKESTKTQNKIDKISNEILYLNEDKRHIEEDLQTALPIRKEILQVKNVIENYILQGIEPSRKVVITNPRQQYKIINPIHEVKTIHQKIDRTPEEERRIYFDDIYKMFFNQQSDEKIYNTLKSYSTDGLLKIQKINDSSIKGFQELLDSKAKMDMRVGRKPKGYQIIINNIRKYEKTYSFVKKMHPIVYKILNERQRTEQGTEPIQELQELSQYDTEKLRELIKKYPELKNTVSNALLSEIIKTGTINKNNLEKINEFLKKENIPVTFNVPIRQTISEISQIVQVKKPVKLEDYADLIPPRRSIIRF